MGFPTEKEVRKAYQVISQHINRMTAGEEDDPLLDELRHEHPTLQMTLLRILVKACSNNVWKGQDGKLHYDGRYSEDWALFVEKGYVPFI